MMDEGGGVRKEGKRLSVKEEGSGGELGSDLDPWKILWIRIRQKDAEPLDTDPQHCKDQFLVKTFFSLCFHSCAIYLHIIFVKTYHVYM